MIDNQACTLRAAARRFYKLRLEVCPDYEVAMTTATAWQDGNNIVNHSSAICWHFFLIFFFFEAHKYLHNCCICCACPSSPSPTAKWKDKTSRMPQQQGKCAPKIFLPSAKRQLLQPPRQQQQPRHRHHQQQLLLLLRQTWSCCRC